MAANFQPPYFPLYLTLNSIPVERFCRTIRIPNDPRWVGLVDGVLTALTSPAYWRKFGTLTPEEMAEAWQAMIEDSWTIEGCPVEFDVRQNPDEPCLLEKTFDGGATWTTFADLQACPPLLTWGFNGLNVGYHTPEGFSEFRVPDGAWIDNPPEDWFTALEPSPQMLAQTNDECLAAANAVNVLWQTAHDVATQLIDIVGGQTLALAEFDTGLALIFNAAISGYVSTAISLFFAGIQGLFAVTDFSEADQQLLICLIQDNMTGTDGDWSINFGAVDGGMIGVGITEDVANCISFILSLIGSNGLNLAAKTTQVGTADCSDCDDTWSHFFDFTLGSEGWTFGHVAETGSGLQPVNFDQFRLIQGSITFASTVITSLDWDMDFTAGHDGGYYLGNAAGTSRLIEGSSNTSGHHFWSGSATLVDLFMNVVCSDTNFFNGDALVRSLTVAGTGTDPFA